MLTKLNSAIIENGISNISIIITINHKYNIIFEVRMFVILSIPTAIV